MSSEAITRNDLREILSRVVGSVPSEYKKLLWTNTQGAQTSYSFTADFSNYDVIEVQFNRVGCIHSFTMANTGSANFVFPYEGYFVVRTATISGNTMSIANGAYYGTYNNGTLTNGASYAVPYKIYGIKYERVAPPQVDASDYVIEQGADGIWTYRIKYERVAPPQVDASDYVIEQGADGIWTYRKWNSGIVECWGKTSISGLTTSVNLPFTFADSSYETQVTLINNSNTATNVTAISSFTDRVSIGVNTVPSGGARLFIIGKWK